MYRKFLKLAQYCDSIGKYEVADKIDQAIRFSSIENEGGLPNRKDDGVSQSILDQINQDPTGRNYSSNPFTDLPQSQVSGDAGIISPSQLDTIMKKVYEDYHNIPHYYEGFNDENSSDEYIDYEAEDEKALKEMRQLASQYYMGQNDPLYGFASSGFFKNVSQRDDALHNLIKDQQNFSNFSPEFKDISNLTAFINTLIPIEFFSPGNDQRFDYLNYATATLSDKDERGFQDFVITVPDTKFYHLQGTITGRCKDGEVIRYEYGLYPEGEGLMVKMKLSYEDVGHLLDAVLSAPHF